MGLAQESLFAPLQRFSSGFQPSEEVGVWWAAPEAVSVWGQAGDRRERGGVSLAPFLTGDYFQTLQILNKHTTAHSCLREL